MAFKKYTSKMKATVACSLCMVESTKRSVRDEDADTQIGTHILTLKDTYL